MDKSIKTNTKFISLFKGLVFSYIITTIILFLLSFIMLKLELSNGVISGGVVFTYIISTFLGGLIVGKVVDSKKYLWGLFLGILYFLVILIISVAMNKDLTLPLTNMMVVFIVCSFSGMLGGMLS